ncbi:hypothetical protein [Empedobacter tilapiae]|uniref:hypothetical protein n=1 Tax=Empedobacter tilapiae TaxID=2491114 RepID=UPI0028D2886D|nr:hypothetical protein [Empedobacter tilapiae]
MNYNLLSDSILNEDFYYYLGFYIDPRDRKTSHIFLLYKFENEIKLIELSDNGIKDVFQIQTLKRNLSIIANHSIDNIPEDFLKQIAPICEVILENKTTVPYNITFHSTKFNQFDGSLELHENDYGLTCSTFIMSIFESIGITLIDIENWNYRDSDKEWQQKVVDYLLKYKDESQANFAKQNIGCFRFRPEEVFSTVSSDTLPCNLNHCEPLGEKIKREFFPN